MELKIVGGIPPKEIGRLEIDLKGYAVKTENSKLQAFVKRLGKILRVRIPSDTEIDGYRPTSYIPMPITIEIIGALSGEFSARGWRILELDEKI